MQLLDLATFYTFQANIQDTYYQFHLKILFRKSFKVKITDLVTYSKNKNRKLQN